jgi:hypothetical protein
MLVRIGLRSASIARVRVVRAPRALPGPSTVAQPSEPERPVEPVYAAPEPATRVDLGKAQHACAAYLAADLVQPRPGLYLHVKA